MYKTLINTPQVTAFVIFQDRVVGCLIASLPIAIVYNFFVDRFIGGLTLGAVKG